MSHVKQGTLTLFKLMNVTILIHVGFLFLDHIESRGTNNDNGHIRQRGEYLSPLCFCSRPGMGYQVSG